jgi:hypothetical protein
MKSNPVFIPIEELKLLWIAEKMLIVIVYKIA